MGRQAFCLMINIYTGGTMKTNEGKMDRIVRVVVGLFLMSLVFWGPQTAWGYIGLIPLFTGLVGFCPLYAVFGLTTCPLSGKSTR